MLFFFNFDSRQEKPMFPLFPEILICINSVLLVVNSSINFLIYRQLCLTKIRYYVMHIRINRQNYILGSTKLSNDKKLDRRKKCNTEYNQFIHAHLLAYLV